MPPIDTSAQGGPTAEPRMLLELIPPEELAELLATCELPADASESEVCKALQDLLELGQHVLELAGTDDVEEAKRRFVAVSATAARLRAQPSGGRMRAQTTRASRRPSSQRAPRRRRAVRVRMARAGADDPAPSDPDRRPSKSARRAPWRRS